MNLLEYHSFYLVGIKGVAMTSLAQCLLDAGKQVRGSDTAEEFVTQEILDQRGITIDCDFATPLPAATECVVYTAAHQGKFNPQVLAAQQQHLPVYSQAEAIASLFNQKQGLAVCGVGGKSTTSAMITWILEKTDRQPSFSVGVGNIPGLGKTGQWRPDSQYFVAEADEYVIDATAPSRGEEIMPRFSFMNPYLTVCTNLRFDHPDVYRDFDHTKAVYAKFFSQIKGDGYLVVNRDDEELWQVAQQTSQSRQTRLVSFGESEAANIQLLSYQSDQGKTVARLRADQEYMLELRIPGKYNVMNALAALTVCYALHVPLSEAVVALKDFRSTIRRAELVGAKNGITFYDDYAHHPNEVAQVIKAFKEWYPQSRLVVAFQSHTYSRTKALFEEFATAFAQADEVAMIDIFPSAREPYDASVTSDMLCEAITQQKPELTAQNYKTLEGLAEHLRTSLKPGDVCLTVGAGDIYKVHQLI